MRRHHVHVDLDAEALEHLLGARHLLVVVRRPHQHCDLHPLLFSLQLDCGGLRRDVCPVIAARQLDVGDPRVRARRAPRASVAPRPVTASSRPPPLVTSAPVASAAVRAWNTVTPFERVGVFDAGDHAAGRVRRSRSSRSPPRRAAAERATGRARRRRPTRAARPRRPASPGTTASHSGSPKRTLNSTSFGPVAVEHEPGVKHAAVVDALRVR